MNRFLQKLRNIASRYVTVARLLLLGAAVPFLVWMVILSQYGVNIPWKDQWDTPGSAMIEVFEGDFSLSPFFRQHNEARKLFPSAVSVGLVWVTGEWNLRTELFVGFALCAALVVLMYGCLHASGLRNERLIAFLTLFYSLVLWSPLTWYFHIFSITFERLIPEVCLLAGVWLYLRGTSFAGQVAAFACLSFVAQYSFPGGIAIWCLLFVLLLAPGKVRIRRRWPGLLAYLLLFAASSALYFWNYHRPGHHSELSAILDASPVDAAVFFFAVLGRAFVEKRSILQPGLLVFVLYCASLAVVLYRNPRRPVVWAWMVVGGYSICQAVLGCLGRLPMGSQHAWRRDYVTYGLFIAMASLVLCSLAVKGKGRERGWVTVGAALYLLCFIAGSGVEPVRKGLHHWYHKLQRGKACAQLAEFYKDAKCAQTLYPPPKAQKKVERRFKKFDELGIQKPGLVKQIVARDGPGAGCVSSVKTYRDVVFLRGWAAIGRRPAPAVVLTAEYADGDERVVGVFGTGTRPKDVTGRMGQRLKYAGWSGVVSEVALPGQGPTQGSCGLNAYAFDTETNTFYRLNWEAPGIGSCGSSNP